MTFYIPTSPFRERFDIVKEVKIGKPDGEGMLRLLKDKQNNSKHNYALQDPFDIIPGYTKEGAERTFNNIIKQAKGELVWVKK